MTPMLKIHLYKVFNRLLLTNGVETGEMTMTEASHLQTIEGQIVKLHLDYTRQQERPTNSMRLDSHILF